MVYATKRFDLKRSALDIKEEKLGQFSVCRGGEARLLLLPLFFDKGRGAAGRRGEGRGGEGRASFVSSDTYSEFLRRFSSV